MEQSLRQALVLSDGSYFTLVARPLSLVLLILSGISLFAPYLIGALRRLRATAPAV